MSLKISFSIYVLQLENEQTFDKMPYYGLYIPVKGVSGTSSTNGASTTNSVDSANDANKDNNETGK